LAVLCGVSVDRIWQWMQGAQPIPTEVFLRVVDILDAHGYGKPPDEQS
jgi:hypothetical protein